MTPQQMQHCVTGLKKIIENLDAQKTSVQKTIDLIQSNCEHNVTSQSGPYMVCCLCSKIL